MEFEKVLGLVQLTFEILLEIHDWIVFFQVGFVVAVVKLGQMLIFPFESLDLFFEFFELILEDDLMFFGLSQGRKVVSALDALVIGLEGRYSCWDFDWILEIVGGVRSLRRGWFGVGRRRYFLVDGEFADMIHLRWIWINY